MQSLWRSNVKLAALLMFNSETMENHIGSLISRWAHLVNWHIHWELWFTLEVATTTNYNHCTRSSEHCWVVNLLLLRWYIITFSKLMVSSSFTIFLEWFESLLLRMEGVIHWLFLDQPVERATTGFWKLANHHTATGVTWVAELRLPRAVAVGIFIPGMPSLYAYKNSHPGSLVWRKGIASSSVRLAWSGRCRAKKVVPNGTGIKLCPALHQT